MDHSRRTFIKTAALATVGAGLTGTFAETAHAQPLLASMASASKKMKLTFRPYDIQ